MSALPEEILESVLESIQQIAMDEAMEMAGGVLDMLDEQDMENAARAYVADLIRARRRGVRRRRAEQYDAAMSEAVLPDQRVAALMRMRDEQFFCALTNEFVSFAEATAEQHEAMAARHEAQIRGHERARDRHQDAAERIRRAGVSCLADLVEEGAA